MGVASQSNSASTTKRLFVGGLTPSIASKDLQDRFGMFGTVQDVETVGLDGLGQTRNFAYLTITSTPQDMKRCLNIMQGSTWRGAKLKIAPAKVRYDVRLASERPLLPSPSPAPLLPPAQHRKLQLKQRRDRKRKRMESDADGYQCGDMRVVDEANWEEEGRKRQHWHIATTQPSHTSLLIRPVLIRPTHPIPKPIYPSTKPPPTPKPMITKADTSSGKGGKSQSSIGAEKNKGEESKPKKVKVNGNGKPMKRARRIWIDPSRYGTYRNQEDLAELLEGAAAAGEAIDAKTGGQDEWEWRSEDDNASSADEDEENLARPSRCGAWYNMSNPLEPTQPVPSKRRRLAIALAHIAEQSTWPAEILEIKTVPEKQRAEREERRRVRAEEEIVVSLGDDDLWGEFGGGAGAIREASPLFAPMEMVDDGSNVLSAGGGAGLFDDEPILTVSPPTLVTSLPIATQAVSSDNLTPAFDSDAETSSSASSITSSARASSARSITPLEHEIPIAKVSAGLFDSPPASPVVAVSIITSLSSSTSEQGESSDDDEMSMHEDVYASVADFAEAERKRGWAVLGQLGFSPQAFSPGGVTPVRAEAEFLSDVVSQSTLPAISSETSGTHFGDYASANEVMDKGDKAEGSTGGSTGRSNGERYAGNGSDSQPPATNDKDAAEDVEMDGDTAQGGDADDSNSSSSDDENSDEEDASSDSSSSDSSSDSSSESDTDSDSDSDSDSDEEADATGDTPGQNEPKSISAVGPIKARQSLKDMFAPKEDSGLGFSLLGNLDLDLESDLDEDVLQPSAQAGPSQQLAEPLTFAPMPVVGATFDGTLPLFFDFEAPADTPPFARCETDEEMTAYWNAEKLSMTRDYKKRHREAVKKMKRGFAIAKDDV